MLLCRPKLNRCFQTRFPTLNNMNHSQQTVLIAPQTKLGDTLTPVPFHVVLNIPEDLKSNRKTLAVREFIKQQGALVPLVQPTALDDEAESKRALHAEDRPRRVEALAVREGVMVKPSGLDHAVEDSGERGVKLIIGGHGDQSINPASAGKQKEQS